jgi:hypothetical protein
VITARVGCLASGMTYELPPVFVLRSERYYATSSARFAILESCRAWARFAVFPETQECGLRRLEKAEQLRALYLDSEGTPGALERLFPDLFAPLCGCPF